MTEAERHRLRTTFDREGDRYDRSRPGYPAEMFDDLTTLVPTGSSSHVLEIGCGTGQATLPLAQRGYAITAVELGANLANFARHNLADFSTVRVVKAAFEDWPLPTASFDLVLAATAFHWIDPSIRMNKAADALRPGGALAVISTHHVAGGTNAFFTEVQRCYERFDSSTPPNLRLPSADDVPCDSTEFDESQRFGPVQFLRYQQELTYTSSEYLDLLSTYSGHLDLPEANRQGLLACIKHMIDNQHDGVITKRYLFQTAIAYVTR